MVFVNYVVLDTIQIHMVNVLKFLKKIVLKLKTLQIVVFVNKVIFQMMENVQKKNKCVTENC